MNRLRSTSYCDMAPAAADSRKHPDGAPLEGVSANVKLLLKLIQDHHHESIREDDSRKPQRVAGMITILDDVRSRIEKSNQLALAPKPRLLRCNTDVRRSSAAAVVTPHRNMAKLPLDPATEENHRLHRELSASVTAQKCLQRMFSSLGKEKEIIAAELARNVREMTEMEELVNDLKAQNEMLTEKVKTCAAEHKGSGVGGRDFAGLEERNKLLAEQLLKSLDSYRSVKRRMKEEVEERTKLQVRVAETEEGVAAGIRWISGACERVQRGKEGTREVVEMLVLFERVLLGLRTKLSKGKP